MRQTANTLPVPSRDSLQVKLIIGPHWLRQWPGARGATNHRVNQRWPTSSILYISLGFSDTTMTTRYKRSRESSKYITCALTSVLTQIAHIFCEFQYRLYNYKMTTNILVRNWKIKTSNLCLFCNEEHETILHSLIQCYISKCMWVTVWEKRNTILGSRIILTKSERMLRINGYLLINSYYNKGVVCTGIWWI